MRVPINDLSRQNGAIEGALNAAIERVVRRGRYILGPEVEAFEAEFARYCGAAHCIGTGNGTDALELALRAAGVRAGGAVATVANAGMYSTTAIRAVGAIPVWVDVDASSLAMCPEALSAALGETTSAVVVTHLYGRLAPVAEICRIADERGIPVIEDCAQAHGAEVHGRKSGAWGRFGCFSFYPTKNLGALGDGGAVVTNCADSASRLRALRQYGWTRPYHSEMAGGRNSRLDELQAAVLRAKLPLVDEWNARRRAVASRYDTSLAAVVQPRAVRGSLGARQLDDVCHLYVVCSPERDSLRSFLAARGIGAGIHYPIPDHRQQSQQGLPARTRGLEVTERCCAEVLTLPCFPELEPSEQDWVIESVAAWGAGRGGAR